MLSGSVEYCWIVSSSITTLSLPYLHSTRAELLRRIDRTDEARAAYERVLALIHTDHERLFVERRLTERRTWPALT